MISLVMTLQAETGYSLDIRFDSQFAIEDHYEEGCSYDWVKVFCVAFYDLSWCVLERFEDRKICQISR